MAGIFFRYNDPLPVAVLGFGLCAAFLAHLVLGLRARWRFHYVTICRFFVLVLTMLLCFAAVSNATFRADRQAGRAYLEQIKPHLEDYRQNNGHYPDDLSDIPNLPTPPSGFLYRREKDPQPGNPDTYRIDYNSQEYWSGTGEWIDDD